MKETCDTCIHAEVCKYTKELNGCDFWQNPLEKIRNEIERNRDEWIKGKDAEWHTYDRCLGIIAKYTKGE